MAFFLFHSPSGDDEALQRYFAAYLSDGSLVETAILPHMSKGYVPDQVEKFEIYLLLS